MAADPQKRVPLGFGVVVGEQGRLSERWPSKHEVRLLGSIVMIYSITCNELIEASNQ